jgi:hypothetical protein
MTGGSMTFHQCDIYEKKNMLQINVYYYSSWTFMSSQMGVSTIFDSISGKQRIVTG